MNEPAEIEFILRASEPFTERVPKELLLELLPKITRWDWLIECSVRNYAAPLIYHNLNTTGILSQLQPKYQKILELHYRNSFMRNLRLRSVFIEITKKLLSHKIAVIALKGIALQHELYSNPALRPMIDIDILIREEQAGESLHILTEMGCNMLPYSESKYIDSFKHHFPPMLYKGIAIELHRYLFDTYDPIQLAVSSIWEKAKHIKIEELDVYVPEQHHQLLFLCHHVYSTLRGGSVRLIWYTDIISFINKNKGDINWDGFKVLVERSKANESVYHSLGIVSFLYSEYFPEELFKAEISIYCPHPKEILFYIENTSVSPELTHYYQKFQNIKSIPGKLKYLLNRMFPHADFIRRKYQTSSNFSLTGGYFKEFFNFIFLGTRILVSKFILRINSTKRME
jgi:hypothetical protein